MNTIKSILIQSMLMLMPVFIYAQQIQTDTIKTGIKEKKWSFSLSLGASVVGAGTYLHREMREIGFDDFPPDFNFFNIFTIKNNKVYPKVRNAAGWDMEARMNLSKHSALAISMGKSHHYTVEGYRNYGYKSFDGNGYENHLAIVHDVWFISADYIFRYAPGYGGIAVGPVMAMHRVTEGASPGSGVKTNSIKPGFHVAADIPLFQKKTWFMAFGINYTWLPSTTLGPNAEQFRSHGDSPFPGGQNSSNKTNTIPLSTFKLNVTTGWRF